MNILLIDHRQTLHQFHADKDWVFDFIHTFDFLSATPEHRQTLIESIPADKQNRPGHKTSLLSAQDLAKIPPQSLAPSFDYGLTIIDCAHKHIISINEYRELTRLRFSLLAFKLCDKPINDKDYQELKDYHNLFTHNYIDIDASIKSQILQRIKQIVKSNYKNHSSPPLFLQTYMDLPFSSKATGWKIQSTTKLTDLQFYKNMFLLLRKNNINLTPEQVSVWNTYVNDQREEAGLDIQEKDTFQKIVNKLNIQREKNVLNRLIQKEQTNQKHIQKI